MSQLELCPWGLERAVSVLIAQVMHLPFYMLWDTVYRSGYICHSLDSFLGIYCFLFNRQNKEGKRDTGQYSICWFIFQMPRIARLGQGKARPQNSVWVCCPLGWRLKAGTMIWHVDVLIAESNTYSSPCFWTSLLTLSLSISRHSVAVASFQCIVWSDGWLVRALFGLCMVCPPWLRVGVKTPGAGGCLYGSLPGRGCSRQVWKDSTVCCRFACRSVVPSSSVFLRILTFAQVTSYHHLPDYILASSLSEDRWKVCWCSHIPQVPSRPSTVKIPAKWRDGQIKKAWYVFIILRWRKHLLLQMTLHYVNCLFIIDM